MTLPSRAALGVALVERICRWSPSTGVCDTARPMKPDRVQLALFAALLWLPLAAPAEEAGDGTVISVLSYNIHGLFPLVAKDDPRYMVD